MALTNSFTNPMFKTLLKSRVSLVSMNISSNSSTHFFVKYEMFITAHVTYDEYVGRMIQN